MGITPSGGTIISIGTTAAVASSDTYTPVGEVTNIPAFGRVYSEIKFTSLANRNVRKFKGSRDDGSIELKLGRDISDTGQTAVKAALDVDKDYNFKVELNDDGATSGNHPTTITFKAKVMSFTTEIGDSEQVIGSSCMLSIQTGSIVETAAT